MCARFLARVVDGTEAPSGDLVSRLRCTVALIGCEIPALAGGVARCAFRVPSSSGEVALVAGRVSPGRGEVALVAVSVTLATARDRLDLVVERVRPHRVIPNWARGPHATFASMAKATEDEKE